MIRELVLPLEMEETAGRDGTLPVLSSFQPPRKEWRVSPRTIYEEGAGPVGVDFCSIAINGGGASEEMLQQRLQEISRQREELQHVVIELRAYAITCSWLLDM